MTHPHSWRASPPHSQPPPPNSNPPGGTNLNGNLFLMLGRLIGQGDHIIYRMDQQDEEIAWIKGRLTEGEGLFKDTRNRIDRVETEMRQSTTARIVALLREIASPREWFAGGLLTFLFVKGIVNPELIADLLRSILGKG